MTNDTQRQVDELVEAFFAFAAIHLGEDVRTVLAMGYPERAISAIASAFASYGGKDVYPDEVSKAAAILVHLNRNHPLHNGVKRSAFSVTDYYLSHNGYELEVDAGRALEFLIRVAEGSVEVDEARRWILTNSRGRFLRRNLLRLVAAVR